MTGEPVTDHEPVKWPDLEDRSARPDNDVADGTDDEGVPYDDENEP